MSFLDDLKRQADAVREQRDHTRAASQAQLRATDAACLRVLRYFTTLAEQLRVLRPRSAASLRLDRRHVFEHLPMSDFAADARRGELLSEEAFDHVVLHWQLRSGQRLELVKDFLPDIEQLEVRLRHGGVPFEAEPVRNPDNGKLVEVRYRISVDFRASVRVEPRPDVALLHLRLHNVERLEEVEFDLPADAVDDARLDELARWLLGQPHRFLEGATGLRRAEP